MAASETGPSAGFPPILGENTRVLILGSLPGVRSIVAGEYYAHPRNAFWKIVGSITGIDAQGSYESRCAAIGDLGIGLWDVLASSFRKGSLDSAIDVTSARPNDFASLLKQHDGISRICFNGKKARQLFDRFVARSIAHIRDVPLTTLPSTSPANASMPFEEKLKHWSIIREFLAETQR